MFMSKISGLLGFFMVVNFCFPGVLDGRFHFERPWSFEDLSYILNTSFSNLIWIFLHLLQTSSALALMIASFSNKPVVFLEKMTGTIIICNLLFFIINGRYSFDYILIYGTIGVFLLLLAFVRK